MADIADRLQALLRRELPHDVAVETSHDGITLYPPRKRWAWSSPGCEVVFGDSMVARLRTLVRRDPALVHPDTFMYLEYVAAAVGFAYDEWQGKPGAGVLYLDAQCNGAVQTAAWAEGQHQRRA